MYKKIINNYYEIVFYFDLFILDIFLCINKEF